MEWEWIYPVVGAIFLLIGFVINYAVNRRRFYRRNSSGLETFGSFEKAWGTSCLERLAKLIAIVLLILGAIIFFGYFLKKQSDREMEQDKGETSVTSAVISNSDIFEDSIGR